MTPDWLILARVAHVLGVVIWIGGVGFVTAVLIPAVGSLDDASLRAEVFERLENRFAWIARGAVLLVGASGFYMIVQYDLWTRFSSIAYWWMHAMVALWTIFAVLLFVAEPLFLHRRFSEELRRNPDRAFTLIRRAHWFLWTASLLVIAGAVAGAHGYGF